MWESLKAILKSTYFCPVRNHPGLKTVSVLASLMQADIILRPISCKYLFQVYQERKLASYQKKVFHILTALNDQFVKIESDLRTKNTADKISLKRNDSSKIFRLHINASRNVMLIRKAMLILNSHFPTCSRSLFVLEKFCGKSVSQARPSLSLLLIQNETVNSYWNKPERFRPLPLARKILFHVFAVWLKKSSFIHDSSRWSVAHSLHIR